MKNNKKVTIVVPVYGDWESLDKCINSLIKNTDASHKVIFVNDCGPEVHEIEKKLKNSISKQSNFSYFRNQKNLGFVGTCNRAVFELDETDNDILLLNSDTEVTEGFLEEMLEVLYASERHGITFPRSNNATIATIPLNQLDDSIVDDMNYSFETYKKIKGLLPRYTITPTGVGFCLLIKRQLIQNFGLFDPGYGLGYHEENDFCQRVNQYGFSIVMSNHAFVYHLESRSFTPEKKKKLNEINEKRLLVKYPYYTSLVQRYIEREIHPVDHFADVIAGLSKRKKILINLFHFPAAFNGTTKTGHSLLRYLKEVNLDENIEITIFTQPEAEIFHNLSSYGFRILYPNTIGNEVFNVGFCPGQIFHADNLVYMNRHCYRNVFSLLDIISLRCEYLRSKNYKLRTIFYDAIKTADRIISISDFTKADASAYFTDLDQQEIDKIQTVHMGYPGDTFEGVKSSLSSLPAKVSNMIDSKTGYVLVFGNDFKHKAIHKVIEQAKVDETREYILLGPHSKSTLPDNITVLPSGALDDATINELLEKSKVILFPSQYEGFGFPILEAVQHKKPLVYFASEVGDEIVSLTTYKHTYPIKIFKNLIDAVENAWLDSDIQSAPKVRQLRDYDKEVLKIIIEELDVIEPDSKKLEERWNYIGRMSDYYFHNEKDVRYSIKVRGAKLLQRKSPKLYLSLRNSYHKHKQ